MSHSAKKSKRGTLSDLLTYIQLQNIKKLEGGKIFEVAQCRKNPKEGPFRHVRFL